MFIRLAVTVLAVIGLFSLFSSGGTAAAAGAGVALLAPLFIVGKIAFFMLIFGMLGRGFGHRSPWGRQAYQRPERGDQSSEPITEADFEEWHRLNHAKDEVDGWVSEIS